MNSRIFTGQVMHARRWPKKHHFSYHIYLYAFDLDELEMLDATLPFFGYNRFNIVSIHDKDYVTGEGRIRDEIISFLMQQGYSTDVSKIVLVTAARYFNYVFNPISFYYCYDQDEKLSCTIAEINNTYGERHLYILNQLQLENMTTHTSVVTKDFYVSPFYQVKGDYEFIFIDLRHKLDIRINILEDCERVFLSRIWGDPLPLNRKNLVVTLLKYPLTAALTMPRILWQAAKLHFVKELPVYAKPSPSNPLTIKAEPYKITHKIGMPMTFKVFSRYRNGCLRLRLPNGDEHVFGDSTTCKMANIQVNDYDFFWYLASNDSIGFGEAYQAGFWDSDNLTQAIQFFAENLAVVDKRQGLHKWLSSISDWLYSFFQIAHRNTISRSKKNISMHYDLSNGFFKEILDPTMTYSCALFEQPDDSLEQAQCNKINAIIHKAKISSADHVLEIGSGWGSFSIQAALQTGCRVTTITLSEQQLQLASQRVQEAGVSELVQVKLCDYRHLNGEFDKIVSIEMIEAVGHENLGAFFSKCDQLLKPDGLFVLQAITMPDQRYQQYNRRGDWIQKHIFPGGVAPSLTVLCQAITEASNFIIEDLENIGIYYARTLQEWKRKLFANRASIEKLGFDEKLFRTWEYYFSYCEAGFASRVLGDLQLILTRPNNKNLGTVQRNGFKETTFRNN